MGACISGESVFAKVEPRDVGTVSTKPDLVGQQVQVVGRVMHTEALLESPFGERQGVAIKIVVSVAGHGNAPGPGKRLFAGSSGVPFAIGDGVHQILVDKGSWSLQLKKTRDHFNIVRDDTKGCLLSGGPAGTFNEVEERPHLRKFWEDFNGGKDDPLDMTPFGANVNGMSAFGNRPREAAEYVLEVGDLVAVVGMLRDNAGKLTLEAGGEAAMTNIGNRARALQTSTAKVPLTSQSACTSVLQMTS
eukprot:gnl/TRDRNA2_/TRDRNA2_207260_c0_seq1.p1 gnl/TRDRNA2_/TRDRNA2_207260_c0~~gnl/TRDRNA2_/TRDRNA2_207260_c0_seq1.p1  ORF type:complete len:247 (-),score=43.33 gnl/TRDRNA2_/TRDRNA2_207260_c0_seq1:227-967(-)